MRPLATVATALGAAVVLGLGTACTSVPPAAFREREPLPPCGEERSQHGESLNVEARQCLFDAYRDGRAAELIVTQVTIEGDPITEVTRVYENGTVERWVDATQDSWGSGEWERLLCDRLVAVQEYNDPPNRFLPWDHVFVAEDCTPASTDD